MCATTSDHHGRKLSGESIDQGDGTIRFASTDWTVKPDEVRRAWDRRAGEFSPEYYAYRGADDRSATVLACLQRYLDLDASILELGCSSGRHLAHLHENGFQNLSGVELNGAALEVLAETYPDLAAVGSFYEGAFESVLGDLADGAFDAVYSVESLQHVHPQASWIFAEIGRISDELILTIENERPAGTDTEEVTYVDEDLPLYHRNWDDVFGELGFVQISVRDGDRDTVRVFESVE